MALRASRIALAIALLALALVFAMWFHNDRHRIAALMIFALPPLLLSIGVLRDRAKAAFWSGVLALFWFSHGVMVAWSRPAELGYAVMEIALALTIIFAVSLPGMRARFAKKSS